MKHGKSVGKGKAIAVAVVVLAAAALTLALYGYIIAESQIVRDTVAVVSDHSGKIVWVGQARPAYPRQTIRIWFMIVPKRGAATAAAAYFMQ